MIASPSSVIPAKAGIQGRATGIRYAAPNPNFCRYAPALISASSLELLIRIVRAPAL
jgi:hypothetical protein